MYRTLIQRHSRASAASFLRSVIVVQRAHLNLLVTQLQQMQKQAQPWQLGMAQSLPSIITAAPLSLCRKTLSLRLLLVIHGVDQGLPAFFGSI